MGYTGRSTRGRDATSTSSTNAAGSRSRAAARAVPLRRSITGDSPAQAYRRAPAPAAPGADRPETPKQRGERTRVRIAEAAISLLENGDPAPTAKAVAEHSGVSVRLVFHHFADMAALYRMVMSLQYRRHWEGARPVDPDLPLDVRIERTVQQRAKLFEAIGPVRRAGVALAPRFADVADGVARSDALLRSWLETTFSRELEAAGPVRRELLDTLDATTSWEAWDRLRRAQRLPARTARRIVAGCATALMSGTRSG